VNVPGNPENPACPVFPEMASQQMIQHRHSVIRGWLESGVPPQNVATMAASRFFVSRSTAYDDIKTVMQTIELSDDGPASEEVSEFNPQAIRGMLQYQFDIAAANGDVPAMTKLVAAIDKVKQWQAPCQTSVSPYA